MSERQAQYKNAKNDSGSLRRNRVDQVVALRKEKRDDVMAKRRSILSEGSSEGEDILFDENIQKEDILPFMEKMEKLMHADAVIDTRTWISWLNAVLVKHSSYLSSISDFAGKAELLTEWVNVRVRNLEKLLKLQGKLGVIAQQMVVRSQPVTFTKQEAIMEMDA